MNCSRMGDVLSDSVTPPLELLLKRTWKKGALEKGMWCCANSTSTPDINSSRSHGKNQCEHIPSCVWVRKVLPSPYFCHKWRQEEGRRGSVPQIPLLYADCHSDSRAALAKIEAIFFFRAEARGCRVSIWMENIKAIPSALWIVLFSCLQLHAEVLAVPELGVPELRLSI